MSTDYAHTSRARDARLAKADALATLFHESGQPWPTTPKERRAAERIAGVRTCSDETWAQARLLLDDLTAHHPREECS